MFQKYTNINVSVVLLLRGTYYCDCIPQCTLLAIELDEAMDNMHIYK